MLFTEASRRGVSIVGMTAIITAVRRSLVGDIESEYDEFDLDQDLEQTLRSTDWLEPSW